MAKGVGDPAAAKPVPKTIATKVAASGASQKKSSSNIGQTGHAAELAARNAAASAGSFRNAGSFFVTHPSPPPSSSASSSSSSSSSCRRNKGGRSPDLMAAMASMGNIIPKAASAAARTPNNSGEVSNVSSCSVSSTKDGHSGEFVRVATPKVNANAKEGKRITVNNVGNGNVLGGNSAATTGNILKPCSNNRSKPCNINNSGSNFVNPSTALAWLRHCSNPEEANKLGNDLYKQGDFAGALALYDQALALAPVNPPAAYRNNRATALASLGRLAEAVVECEEALKSDPSYMRAHRTAASLYLRLGQLERSKQHCNATGALADWADLQRIQIIQKHVSNCVEARRSRDWKTVIKESDAAVVSGADSAPKIFCYKAEALLKNMKREEADMVLSAAERLENALVKLGIMLPDSLLLAIRAQVDMALGRFEAAVAAAESGVRINPDSNEMGGLLWKARVVCKARASGNALFKAGRFFEACAAYGEGLENDPNNAVLLCNRAACRSKLQQWEKAVEDCDAALSIQPNYTKALLRRANCHAKLERWEDAVRDYEVLSREMRGDMEVARGFFDVQVARKKSRGEDVRGMRFGGEVQEVSTGDQFKQAVTLAGLVVVVFSARWSDKCKEVSPFIDQLCKKYPSANFFKVNVDENSALTKTQNVSFVPTFKIFKERAKVKEIEGWSPHDLEYALKHYEI